MSNNFNRIFWENNYNDNDSDKDNSQEESSIISTSQPGRELEEFDFFNQQYLEGRQQRQRHQPQQSQIIQPQTLQSQFIQPTNQFTIPPINNVEANLEQVTTMDTTQFNQLIMALGQLTNQLGKPQGGNVPATAPPRIAVQIPIFKGEPRENVAAWLMQVGTIFAAQGIDDTATRCYYASTGMKEAALHWYLARMTEHGNNTGVPWGNWNDFKTAVQTTFQPPNYQSYLR